MGDRGERAVTEKSVPSIDEVMEYVGQQMPGYSLEPLAGVYNWTVMPGNNGKDCSVTDRRTGQVLRRLYHIEGGRWQEFTPGKQEFRRALVLSRWQAKHPLKARLGWGPSKSDLMWEEFDLGTDEMDTEWGNMTLGGGL